MNISQAVAARIHELLEINKITLYKLEQKAGLSHDTLKSILKGKAKGVNLRTVIAISDGFDMDVHEFLNSKLFQYNNLNMD